MSSNMNDEFNYKNLDFISDEDLQEIQKNISFFSIPKMLRNQEKEKKLDIIENNKAYVSEEGWREIQKMIYELSILQKINKTDTN